MIYNQEIRRKTNRHIAKLLDALDSLFVIPADAKSLIKDKMHFLAQDISQEYTHGQINNPD